MPDSFDSVFLENICVIQKDIASIKEDISEIKNHLTSIESCVTQMRCEIAAITPVGQHVGPTA